MIKKNLWFSWEKTKIYIKCWQRFIFCWHICTFCFQGHFDCIKVNKQEYIDHGAFMYQFNWKYELQGEWKGFSFWRSIFLKPRLAFMVFFFLHYLKAKEKMLFYAFLWLIRLHFFLWHREPFMRYQRFEKGSRVAKSPFLAKSVQK